MGLNVNVQSRDRVAFALDTRALDSFGNKCDRFETFTQSIQNGLNSQSATFFDITVCRNEITLKAPPGEWICK